MYKKENRSSDKKENIMEITLTKNNFEKEVMQSEKPVLVDFWASWCGPCRMLAPVIEEIAKDYEGSIKVGKVNVDDEEELASYFQIMSIPTVMIFKNGKIAESFVGVKPRAQIDAVLAKYKA